MSLGVLRCYFLQKKLCSKLMIFQGFSPNTSHCVRGCIMVLGKCCLLQGRRTRASKDVLSAQHNTEQGSGSARVVPVVYEGDILQGHRQLKRLDK